MTVQDRDPTSQQAEAGDPSILEPSGNHYSVDEIHIFRIRDGQLVEHWHQFDKMSLMRQLRGGTTA